MPTPTKYRKKYTKQLINGLRKDGRSIEEVCQEWGITPKTYGVWRDKYPEFADAHLIGECDKNSWWRQLQRKVSSGESPGNASCINMALKNECGYVDKQEVQHTHDEQITTIRIERIESKPARIIEHDSRAENLLDKQPS
jgi:transposase-like protein